MITRAYHRRSWVWHRGAIGLAIGGIIAAILWVLIVFLALWTLA